MGSAFAAESSSHTWAGLLPPSMRREARSPAAMPSTGRSPAATGSEYQTRLVSGWTGMAVPSFGFSQSVPCPAGAVKAEKPAPQKVRTAPAIRLQAQEKAPYPKIRSLWQRVKDSNRLCAILNRVI